MMILAFTQVILTSIIWTRRNCFSNSIYSINSTPEYELQKSACYNWTLIGNEILCFSQLIAACSLPICYCSLFCSDRWTPDVVSKMRYIEKQKITGCSTVIGRETRSGSRKLRNDQRGNLKKNRVGFDPTSLEVIYDVEPRNARQSLLRYFSMALRGTIQVAVSFILRIISWVI